MDTGPDDNDFGAYGAGGFSGDSPIDDSWTADATGTTNVARRAAATEKALANEKSASGGASGGSLSGKNGNGISAAKNAESDASDKTKDGDKKSDFKNNVTGKMAEKAAGKAVPGGKILVKQAKKLGPLGVILVVLGICMGLFSASQSLAPFGLVANALDQFNVLRTVMSKSTKQYGFRTLGTVNNTTNKANRILTSNIAGWFDTSSESLHRFRLSFRRNRYGSTDKNLASDTEIIEAASTGVLADGLGSVIEGTEVDQEEATIFGDDDISDDQLKELESSENGGLSKESTGFEKDSGTSTDIVAVPDANEDLVKQNLSDRAKGTVASMGDKVGVYCGIVKAYSAIQLAISAIHVASVLNYITNFVNAVQQAQSGDGGAALNYFMRELSQKGDTTGLDTNMQEELFSSNKSSLESDAWNQFFSNGDLVISADNSVARKFNKDYAATNGIRNAVFGAIGQNAIDNNVSNWKTALASAAGLHSESKEWGQILLNELNNPIDLYKSCILAQNAVGLATLGVDAAEVAIAIFTGGISVTVGALKDFVLDLVYDIALNIVTESIISAVMSFIVPSFLKWLSMDLISDMAGEDAAYAINSGFNMYLGKQMQQSSGLPGTEEQVVAQYRETQIVIAEEAEYQRSIRSPFDPTSKYTFLGSIVNTLTPIANSLSSPLSIVSGTMQTVGSAITSLKPTAAAEGETVFKGSLNKNCPGLSEMEGYELVGDAFCNPYFVSDYETLTSDSPYTSISEVEAIDSGAFDYSNSTVSESGEEIPAIASGSELSKWAIACTQRESQFGIADSAVASALEVSYADNDLLNTILSEGLNHIPYIGDIVTMVGYQAETSNLPWTTGEACLSEEAMVYSRYSEDQRWLESAGEIEQSAVAAFVEDYYEKNPVDNSLSGVIARFSGMSKEMTEDTLAIIEYIDYIAEYDPTDTWPLGVQEAYTYLYESGNATENEDLGENVVPVKRVIYENFGANTTLV